MPKEKEDSILLKNPEEEETPIPDYTEEETTYLGNLRKRLKYAQERRDEPHEEFDGMPYITYWQSNERWANTYIRPKRDKAEIRFQSGTLRTKLFSFLSSLKALNLKPDLIAYDKNNLLLSGITTGMEDIIEKTEEMENDEEKQTLRQYELLKHGTIFVEDVWEVKQVVDKELTKGFKVGEFKKRSWKVKKTMSEGKPVRTILTGIKVYLGDLKTYLLKDQPFFFTVTTMPYEKAEKIYGEWEMWDFVTRKKMPFEASVIETEVTKQWHLQEPPKGEVEIIKYQDLPNNEYQILINGIPMFPLGFPLPWGRFYNVEQQNLEPIRYDFAYGKSFVFKNKNNVALSDELTRLGLLKSWKSLLPPLINTSNRYINQSVMMPGRITMGADLAGALKPVYDGDVAGGVTGNEFTMMREISRTIDQNTASQTASGQPEQGNPTATEVVTLRREGMRMMGITIAASALLEKKLALLRLNILLKEWFNPLDTVVDSARGVLKEKYRIVSSSRTIDDEGQGIRFVVPTDREFTPDQVRAEEDKLEDELNMPIRMILIKPKELAQAGFTWFATVNPKPKTSDDLAKLMFKGMVSDGVALGLPFNPAYIQQEFAKVWEQDPNRLFLSEQPQPIQPQEGGQQEGSAIAKPTVNQLQNMKEAQPTGGLL